MLLEKKNKTRKNRQKEEGDVVPGAEGGGGRGALQLRLLTRNADYPIICVSIFHLPGERLHLHCKNIASLLCFSSRLTDRTRPCSDHSPFVDYFSLIQLFSCFVHLCPIFNLLFLLLAVHSTFLAL